MKKSREDKTVINPNNNCQLAAFRIRVSFNARVFYFEVENVLENFASSISFVVFWKESVSGTYLQHFTSVLNGFCDSSTAGESSHGGERLILIEALPFNFKRTPSIRFEWNSLMKFLAQKFKIFGVPAKPLQVTLSNPQSSVVREENLPINCCGHFCVFCCTPVETYLENHKTWVWTIKARNFGHISQVVKIHILIADTYLNLYCFFFLPFLCVSVH